jgi:hypothetical protein
MGVREEPVTISNQPAVVYTVPAPESLEDQLRAFNERVGRLIVDLCALEHGDNGSNWHGAI